MRRTLQWVGVAIFIGTWLPMESAAPMTTGILRTKPSYMRTVLAADIGGTYTRMSLVEIGRPWRNLSAMRSNEKYTNSEYSCFDDIISQFLENVPLEYSRPSSACFAVAGPCLNDIGTLTNGGNWIVNGADIADKYGMNSVKVVNDFVACGYGLLTLNDEEDCCVIQAAVKTKTAPIACIGAGTGLGQCFLVPAGAAQGYECFPSEGGHAEFAPHSELEAELLEYLSVKLGGRVSVERVVSGTGIPNIYEFLAYKYPDRVDPLVHAEIGGAHEFKSAVICKHQSTDSLCGQSMEIFYQCYGAEAGLAGLKWLPYGGLYLTGGLTPRSIEHLQNPNGLFLKSFHNKGRVSSALKDIPVFGVLVDDLGERGAHYIAARELMRK